MPFLAAFLAQRTTTIVRLGHVARHHHSPQDKTQQWPALHLIEIHFLHITLNCISPLSYATISPLHQICFALDIEERTASWPRAKGTTAFQLNLSSICIIRKYKKPKLSFMLEGNLFFCNISFLISHSILVFTRSFVFAMATWKPWCDKVRLRIRA